eukprot:g6272.t1
MAVSMTTLLYVVVLAGWFLLMCVVLRCCSDSESQSVFDLEEIHLSAAGYYDKPTTIVDGQPVRFARVQPLGESPQAVPGAATTAGSGNTSAGHHHEQMALEHLEIPIATSALPSAQAVWSPILALRTFVEPLTSRASAAFRNFHISFHDPEEEEADGVGVTTTSTLSAEAASPPQGAAVAAAAAGMADEERGDGGGRRKGELSLAAALAEAAATAAPEDVRVASAEHRFPPDSGGIELSVVSSGHDREEGAGGGGDGERERVHTMEEMVERDEKDENRDRVAV